MPVELTPQQIAWRDRARQDFPFFCETAMKIRPKRDLSDGTNAPLVPFKFNRPQQIVWQMMVEMMRQGVPIELIICKARQFGISTLFCAWIFWNMWRGMQVHTAIVAQQRLTLEMLLETMNNLYFSFPAGFRPRLRQMSKDARIPKDGFEFVDRHCTNIITPERPDALRGPALDIVLCTEVSSYKKPGPFFEGFVPAMSRKTFSTLVLESSPKDGFFREEYMKAKERVGSARAVFLAWWIFPELYSLPLRKSGRALYDARTGDRVRFDEDEREEQRALSKIAKKDGYPAITDEQMYFRKQQIEKPGWDLERFNQEFPRDDVSCFEMATRSAFKAVLPIVRTSIEAADDLYPEIVAGTLHSDNYDPGKPGFTEYEDIRVNVIEEASDGYIDQERHAGLLMFEPPVPGRCYTVGADVADDSGAIGEDEDDDSAYSVGCVYCANTRHQVAEWRGHIDPHDFGDVLCMLGYLYNTAMIAVERNNMGITTEDRIMRYLRYPLTFRWPDFGTGGGKLTKKAMWETNARTKQIMIGDLKKAVRDGFFVVNSPGLYGEMSGYIVKEGRYKASPGSYADRIIAAALAWQCVEQTEYGYGRLLLAGGVNDAAKTARAKRVVEYRSRIVAPPGRLPDELGGDTMRVMDSNDWEALVPPELRSA